MESGWNVCVWLVGVLVRRYIDFLILLIPTPLVSVLFCSSIPTFCSIFYYNMCQIHIYRCLEIKVYSAKDKVIYFFHSSSNTPM